MQFAVSTLLKLLAQIAYNHHQQMLNELDARSEVFSGGRGGAPRSAIFKIFQ